MKKTGRRLYNWWVRLSAINKKQLNRVNHRIKSINNSCFLPVAQAPMDTQQLRSRIPEIQFRVLIIGRANAGKTTILQRVCETTESPIIYRGNERVRGSGTSFLSVGLIPLHTRFNISKT